jgi:hypothetical protein
VPVRGSHPRERRVLPARAAHDGPVHGARIRQHRATTQQFAGAGLAYGAGFALSAAYFAVFIAGAVVAARRRSPVLWLLVPIAYVPATISVVLTNMRYTITVQPLMFVFVAVAVVAALGLDSPGGERAREVREGETR